MDSLQVCQTEIRRLRSVVRELQEELNQKKIYLLCQEIEGTDGEISFFILQTSFNEQKLKDLLQEKINEDEYGLMKDYGIEDISDTYCKTKYGDRGSVEYYILEQEII